MGEGFSDVVLTLALYNSVLYAGGHFVKALPGINNTNGIAKWEGTQWSEVSGGLLGDVQALAFDNNGDLYVGM